MKLLLFMSMIAVVLSRTEAGIIETLITDLAQIALRNMDPTSFPYTELRITSHEDTDLFFIFKNAQISEFSTLVVTEVDLPIAKHEVKAAARLDRLVAHADNYTTNGMLMGQPYSATGAMDFAANLLDVSLEVSIDHFTFTPFYICLARDSLYVNLTGGEFEANFENADELNAQMNAHGPELVEELQEKIGAIANDIIDWVNFIFCDQ